MKSAHAVKLCVLSTGIWLLCHPGAIAQPTLNPPPSAAPSLTAHHQTILSALEQASVIYLGETHDHQPDHDAQLQIIQSLYQHNPQLAIGMEMFQRPFQPVLDQYLAGEIDETELQQRSQFDRRWGYPWSSYAPILRFAREHHIPVLALNTPSEITHKVALKGLVALTATERQWIPPFSEIHLDSNPYRQFLRPLYEEFHHQEGSSNDFERFFLSQVLWDETMAEGIADFIQAHPDHQVVVLAGQGHIVYGYGIPSRVARRLSGVMPLTQALVLLNPSSDFQTSGTPIADYFWFSEASGFECCAY
jgi:uncharacterized iron-regulated protein